MKFYRILVFMLLTNFSICFAQFNQNTSRSLFSDVKAYKVGDAITILIMEETQADNSAATKDSRSTSLGGSVDANANNNRFNAGGDLSTSTGFAGSGQTTRRENIRSRISARVTKVDEVGNLYIEGKRTTKINGETQTIMISGKIRPVDILPNNNVYSYNILDLSLTIEGDGSVSKIQEPGLITKFLRILF
ncbi:flagellar basal body L-ring protein FlgH [Bacteroidetes/Chlorobi group bacterium MS-B_bin-24]|nr:MAG: flagellar basal body L-ring protein FlgH [Bacteroidetes/Chlorobi group bacterium MS-B_bin-24]